MDEVILFDDDILLGPLALEFPSAKKIKFTQGMMLEEGQHYIIGIKHLKHDDTQRLRTSAVVMTYLYGSRNKGKRHATSLCDTILTQTSLQARRMKADFPKKEVRRVKHPPICAMTLARNNAQDVKLYAQCLRASEKEKWFIVPYILENDSADQTARLFERNVPMSRVYSMKLGMPPLPPGRTNIRTKKLAILRNRLKELIDLDAYEYAIILDTQILWKPETLSSHVSLLEQNDDICMSTSIGHVRRSQNCEFHFDTFATIVDGKHFGYSDNLYECTSATACHDPQCHRGKLGNPPIFKHRRVRDIDSGCGGFAVCRSKAVKHCEWSVTANNACEHWNFCSMMRQHGRIVVNPEYPILWG